MFVKINKSNKLILIILAVFILNFFNFLNLTSAQELININTANSEELDSLPGIGLSKAQAIIDFREQNGNFQNIEEIKNVSRIGETTFENIKDLITVGETEQDDSTQSDGANTENNANNENEETENYSNEIIINELLPNPEGSDDFEWIELKNIGTQNIDLNNWKISDASDKEYIISLNDFDSTVIFANSFFILEKSITGISLNNSGDELKLFNPDLELVSQTNYSDSNENYSWAKNNSGNYEWTNTLTKNIENIISLPIEEEEKQENQNNTEEQNGSSQETGANTESEFKNKILISEFMPNPIGIDNNFNEWIEIYNTSTQEINLDNWKLRDNFSEFIFESLVLGTKIPSQSFLILRRNETGLILNNLGGDFLELIDNQDKQVDKINYTKKPIAGESYNWCENFDKWLWLSETSINKKNNCPPVNDLPLAYFEIPNYEIFTNQNIILNASESYDTDGEIVKYVWEFEKEVEMEQSGSTQNDGANSKIEIKFLNSGKQKIILKVIDNLGGEDEYFQNIKIKEKIIEENFSQKNEANFNNKKAPPKRDGANQDNSSKLNIENYYKKIELSEIKNFEKGTQIQVQGIVSVEPGVLGANIFYINGAQIYSYKKDFPLLTLGDFVQISGEISEAYNETRIKIQDKNNIQIIESGNAPEPKKIILNNDLENFEGSLVQITGEITDLRQGYFWIDDENGEIRITIKPTIGAELDDFGLVLGDKVKITGILSETTTGYRILPRYKSDLIVLKILGEKDNENNKKDLTKYLIALAVFIFLGLGIWGFKMYQKISLTKK